MSIVEKLLEELKAREDLRDALAQELLPSILRDRRLRLVILTALYRDIATKQDLRELRDEIREYIDRRMGELGNKLDRIEARLDKLETRLDKIETRLNRLEARLDKVETRVDRFETRLDRLEARLDSLFKWTVGLILGMWVSIMLTLIPILLKLLGAI